MRTIWILCCAVAVICKEQVVNFDLSENKAVYKEFINVTGGTARIQVVNVPTELDFYIVQVHSFLKNVTLSSTSTKESQTFIEGTNVGLVATENQVFYLDNSASEVFIAITIGERGAPIPGGCNLAFDTPEAPYQLVSYSEHMITVASQAPSAPGTTCDKNAIGVEMYHLYLREGELNRQDYFEGLQKMLTVDAIQANGSRVHSVDGYFKYRKLYSSYRGVGHIFAIIATFKNKSMAYIPAISYGCDLHNWAENCKGPVTLHWKFICAALLIFGAFVCFYGHNFFTILVFVIGLIFGVFITYIMMSFNEDLTSSVRSTSSILIGVVYGIGWLLIWFKFGYPLVSITLTLFLAGFLISSTLFYTALVDIYFFINDYNFWFTNVSIMLLFSIIGALVALHGDIFACSLLGSYSVIAALNYYMGGNLQYVIINAFRRLTVANFNMATIDPPFQFLDLVYCVLWATMVVAGCYFQWRRQQGKPPFPPPRPSVAPSERTPLLSDFPTQI